MEKKKFKVILVSGGFDPVHKGHLEMIESARVLADEVWVILNNDQWLRNKKGKHFMKEDERRYIMSQFKGVTETFICHPRIAGDKTATDGIYAAHSCWMRKYGKAPEEGEMAFGNGGDRGKSNVPEEDYCKSMGISMVWNLGEKVQSSSWLLEKYYNKAI